MKNFIIVFFITISSYLTIDYIFGFYLLDFTKSQNLRIQNHEFGYHSLNSSFDGYEGNIRYCTNKEGFRISCLNKNKKINKHYDIFFIGDSFTEGYQVSYEQSFVGIIDKLTEKKIANLGVTSYSPTIYYEKVKRYIKKGFTFDHLVVYIDISDIQDESVDYADSLTFKKKFKNLIRTLFPFSYVSLRKIIRNKEPRSIVSKIKETNTLPKKYPLVNEDKTKKRNKKNIFLDKNFSKSAWTYNRNLNDYGLIGVEGGIDKSIIKMNELSLLLKKNNIKLSIAVYPWPAQLVYDNVDSDQVKIWRKFCEGKCYRFIDNFVPFFSFLDKTDPKKVVDTYYHHHDAHFNKKGHEILARNFIDAFNN